MTTDALPILEFAAPIVETDPRDRFFDTSHLNKDLKRRTIRAGFLTLTAQAIKFALKMGSTAVLARLLSPADFGLVAMVTVFTGFIEMFKDAGLSTATVQRKHITFTEVSTLFWLNIMLTALLGLILATLSPLVGWFYGDHRLIRVTVVLAIILALSGLSIQPQAIFRRTMRFHNLVAIDLCSSLSGAAAGIAMALHGSGYWSLVAASAAATSCTVAMSFAASNWHPGAQFDLAKAAPLITYGRDIALNGVFSYITHNVDNLIVGRVLGAVALGFYSRAYALMLIPISQILSPIGDVVVPALSRLASDLTRLRVAFLSIFVYISILSAITAAWLFAEADYIVDFVLGPRWMAIVPLFKVLGIYAAIMPLTTSITWLFTVLGEARTMRRWAFIKSVLVTVAVLIGIHWGTLGVSIAFVCTFSLIEGPIFIWISTRVTPLRLHDLMTPIFLSLLLFSLCAFSLSRTKHLAVFRSSNGLQFIAATCTSAIVATTLICIVRCKNVSKSYSTSR